MKKDSRVHSTCISRRQAISAMSGALTTWALLAQRGQDTYNTLVLAHPGGQTYCHDKDLPTGPLETAHWIGGTDNGICDTPEGKIGAAICWEQIRFRTARRLREGRVGVILAPSAFGALDDEGRAGHVELLEHAPENLARLVGAPVIMFNPVGPGILYGTIDIGSVAPSEEMQGRCWIPEMPKYWLDRHENRAAGYKLYQEVIRPSRNGKR